MASIIQLNYETLENLLFFIFIVWRNKINKYYGTCMKLPWQCFLIKIKKVYHGFGIEFVMYICIRTSSPLPSVFDFDSHFSLFSFLSILTPDQPTSIAPQTHRLPTHTKS